MGISLKELGLRYLLKCLSVYMEDVLGVIMEQSLKYDKEDVTYFECCVVCT